MTKNQELAELKGIGKIFDCLWENSYYSMGEKAVERIKSEMVYYFGENWSTDMYKFIQDKNKPGWCRPEMPRPLREIERKDK